MNERTVDNDADSHHGDEFATLKNDLCGVIEINYGSV